MFQETLLLPNPLSAFGCFRTLCCIVANGGITAYMVRSAAVEKRFTECIRSLLLWEFELGGNSCY